MQENFFSFAYMNELYDILFPPVKQTIALNTGRMNNIFAHQRGTKLCWAAGIQMLAAHNNLLIDQLNLASHVCSTDAWGNPYNCPADIVAITETLPLCYQTDHYEYCLKPTGYRERPNLYWLKRQLESNKPVLVAYRPRPDAPLGHVVLITGVEYFFKQGVLHVSKFIVRDPDPSIENRNRFGRKVYNNAGTFYNAVYSYWDVSIKRSELAYQYEYSLNPFPGLLY